MDPAFIIPLYFLWPLMFILVVIRTQLLPTEVVGPNSDYAFRRKIWTRKHRRVEWMKYFLKVNLKDHLNNINCRFNF